MTDTVPRPAVVDWAAWPAAATDPANSLDAQVMQWAAEYAAHVHQPPPVRERLPPQAVDPLAEPATLLDEWSWTEAQKWADDFTIPYGELDERLTMSG